MFCPLPVMLLIICPSDKVNAGQCNVKDTMHKIWDTKIKQTLNCKVETNIFHIEKTKVRVEFKQNQSVFVGFLGFQWPSRLVCVLVFKVKDEGRRGECSLAWRGQQHEHCIHCPCGLLNILMKEPHPERHHSYTLAHTMINSQQTRSNSTGMSI